MENNNINTSGQSVAVKAASAARSGKFVQVYLTFDTYKKFKTACMDLEKTQTEVLQHIISNFVSDYYLRKQEVLDRFAKDYQTKNGIAAPGKITTPKGVIK